MNNYPPGMSNEDLEYLDSPEEEIRECGECGVELEDNDPNPCYGCQDDAEGMEDTDDE